METVFSVRPVQSGYNEEFSRGELSRVLELVVAAENGESRQLKVIEKKWNKGIRLCKEDFIICYSDSETVINPLPGYD
jgi:hypothetical protein